MQICEWLGVSKSGYYDWRTRPESATAQRRELLKIKIRALFEANNEEYGYRRMHQALVRGGESVDDETVRQLMRQLGLVPCQPRPWRHSLTEQGPAGPIPDLVNRDFSAEKPGEKMVGDITPTVSVRLAPPSLMSASVQALLRRCCHRHVPDCPPSPIAPARARQAYADIGSQDSEHHWRRGCPVPVWTLVPASERQSSAYGCAARTAWMKLRMILSP